MRHSAIASVTCGVLLATAAYGAPGDIPYFQFTTDVSQGRVRSVAIVGNAISGVYVDGRSFQTLAPPDDSTLIKRLSDAQVTVTARPSAQPVASSAGNDLGAWSLFDQSNAKITEASLQGHASVLVFGYLFSPDILPTTLSDLTALLKELGPAADKLSVYFVTLDPARDTTVALSDYLRAFDPRIRGLTGSQETITQIANKFGVNPKRLPASGGNYTFSYNPSIFLLDANASVVSTTSYQEDERAALAKLLQLVAANPGALQTVSVPLNGQALDLSKAAVSYHQSGDRIQVATAPTADGIVRRIEVRSGEGRTSSDWLVFALANNGDKQIDRLLVGPRSRIASITASAGLGPTAQPNQDADVYKITLSPGAIITYVVEVRSTQPTQLYLSDAAALKNAVAQIAQGAPAAKPPPPPRITVSSANPSDAEMAALVQQESSRFITAGALFDIGRLDVVLNAFGTGNGRITEAGFENLLSLVGLGIVDVTLVRVPTNLLDTTVGGLVRTVQVNAIGAGRQYLTGVDQLLIPAGPFKVTRVVSNEAVQGKIDKYRVVYLTGTQTFSDLYRQYYAVRGSPLPPTREFKMRVLFQFDRFKNSWELSAVDQADGARDFSTNNVAAGIQ